MAAGSTYTPIYSTTLGSSQASLTLTSFSGYTDLVLVCSVQGASTGIDNRLVMQFNSDTGSNYSGTALLSNTAASTAVSTRDSNRSWVDEAMNIPQSNSGQFAAYTMQFLNYSNTTTYKTVLAKSGNNSNSNSSSNNVGVRMSMWRNTSAITSIKIYGLADNAVSGFNTGSMFTLYGIAAA